MNDYDKWKKLYAENKMSLFNNDRNGILWLKTRAICRKEQMEKFLKLNHIKLRSERLQDQTKELYDKLQSMPDGQSLLDSFLLDAGAEFYGSHL